MSDLPAQRGEQPDRRGRAFRLSQDEGEVIEAGFEELVFDPDLQVRTGGIDQKHLDTLTEAEGFSPLAAVRRNGRLVVVDGHHRGCVLQNRGAERVLVRVLAIPDDADLRQVAFQLNEVHGLALTLADRKAEAARLLTLHPEWSDSEVGRRCGIRQPTVANIRAALVDSSQIEWKPTRVGRGGYTYAAPERRPGELPPGKFMEAVGDAVGRLFTPAERTHQRQVARYLQRLATALDDRSELAGWGSPPEVAEACRLVLGKEGGAALGDRLGSACGDLAAVAVELGHDQDADLR
jgi:hypothetical protein